jgi:hypothetical protein
MMAYDTYDGYVVLFGGLNETTNSTTDLQDTWLFQGGNWTQLSASHTHPSKRDSGMMSTFSARNDVVLFGGAIEGAIRGNHTAWYNDTWSFEVGKWTGVNSSAGAGPLPRIGGELSQYAGVLLLVGGEQLSSNGQVASATSTWFYYGTLAGHARWTQQSPPVTPARTYRASMIWDRGTKSVLLLTAGGTNVTSWTYSYSGGWTRVAAGAPPPGRIAACLAYDHADGYALLFGGHSSSGIMLNDSWGFAGGNWHRL